MTQYPPEQTTSIMYKQFDTQEEAEQFSRECYLGHGTTQFAYEIRELLNEKWVVIISDNRVYDGALFASSLEFK